MHKHRLRTNGLAVVSGLDVGDVLLVPTQTIDTTASRLKLRSRGQAQPGVKFLNIAKRAF